MNITQARYQIKYQSALAQAAYSALYGETEPVYHLACGRYGHIIQMPDGLMAGDLCYMQPVVGWTDPQYMQAYGYLPDASNPGAYLEPNATDNLAIHTFETWHVLVLRLGGDGDGPLGLGFDTGSLSFVSHDRAQIETAQAAMLALLETKRPAIEEDIRRTEKARKASERAAKIAARKAKMWREGNYLSAIHSTKQRLSGGRWPKYKMVEEPVHIRIAKLTPEFVVDEAGSRYKLTTLFNVEIVTPRTMRRRIAA